VPYQDDFGRAINYLRVSVTDRCNLRCVYCMPSEGIAKQTHDQVLSYEEIALVVRAAAGLGVRKVRLTGGEPLARLGLPDLVSMLAGIAGLDDLSMTTNGTLLARHAAALAAAGLRRVNVSLDTLRPERFSQITRRGHLDDVWAGIRAAEEAGLGPIKLNMVVVRGLNDDEVADMARQTINQGLPLILAQPNHPLAQSFRQLAQREVAILSPQPEEPPGAAPGAGPGREASAPREHQGRSGLFGRPKR
jgi:cyclic pyranopterin phosphate synthase